jgi:hypothetical protein
MNISLPHVEDQISSLNWLLDSLKTGALPENHPIHFSLARLTIDAQALAKEMPNPATCTSTYANLAAAINSRNPGTKCRDETLRKLNIFQYLEDKGMTGEFVTNLPGKTKTKFSKRAVSFVAEHYQGLLGQGWKERLGKTKR